MKTEIDPKADTTFQAEAQRLGGVLNRRYWHIGVQAVAIGFSSLGLIFGCLCVGLLHNQYLLGGATAGALVVIFAVLLIWSSHMRKSLKRLLKVTCPLCGGAARFETSPLPDIQIYLACPQCDRRAGTGFKVPFNRRLGGRYAMGYDWETRKSVKPQVMVHARGGHPANKQ